jgi:glycosyltransferase involved in cell wall biosynthesis
VRFAILGSRGFPSTYGGYETLVRHLARHLVASGHDTTVYCRSAEGKGRQWVTENVTCIHTPGLDSKSLSTLSFGATATIDASFRRFDALLVLNIANGFWFPLLKATRTPFAVNTDGIEWERGKWSRSGRAAFRAGAYLTAKAAPALICDSEAIGAIWEEQFNRKSTFIPYGAPVIAPGADKLAAVDLDPSDPYVLVVARLAPENNVELTLDALEILGDAAPRAVVVGSANFSNPLEPRLRRMEQAGRLRWLGHVSDQQLLDQLWANCALYVHGHSVGGTNPALLQALGAGAPTVAFETMFNREVLGPDGVTFSDDAQQLANRISEITASDALQAKLAEQGRRRVRERYDWRDVCDRYESVLLDLATARGR